MNTNRVSRFALGANRFFYGLNGGNQYYLRVKNILVNKKISMKNLMYKLWLSWFSLEILVQKWVVLYSMTQNDHLHDNAKEEIDRKLSMTRNAIDMACDRPMQALILCIEKDLSIAELQIAIKHDLFQFGQYASIDDLCKAIISEQRAFNKTHSNSEKEIFAYCIAYIVMCALETMKILDTVPVFLQRFAKIPSASRDMMYIVMGRLHNELFIYKRRSGNNLATISALVHIYESLVDNADITEWIVPNLWLGGVALDTDRVAGCVYTLAHLFDTIPSSSTKAVYCARNFLRKIEGQQYKYVDLLVDDIVKKLDSNEASSVFMDKFLEELDTVITRRVLGQYISQGSKESHEVILESVAMSGRIHLLIKYRVLHFVNFGNTEHDHLLAKAFNTFSPKDYLNEYYSPTRDLDTIRHLGRCFSYLLRFQQKHARFVSLEIENALKRLCEIVVVQENQKELIGLLTAKMSQQTKDLLRKYLFDYGKLHKETPKDTSISRSQVA